MSYKMSNDDKQTQLITTTVLDYMAEIIDKKLNTLVENRVQNLVNEKGVARG